MTSRPLSLVSGNEDLVAHRVGFRVDHQQLLNEVNCLVRPGSVVGLVGANGAGKSTLLRILAGVTKPSEGTVTFAGQDLHGLPARRRAQVVALVEQRSHTELDLRVHDVVELGRTPHLGRLASPSTHDLQLVDDALRTAGVEQFADRKYATLSGGERQRVHIAAALAQAPRMLMLDEPTNHLDIKAQLEILDLLPALAAAGTAVIVALHDLTHAASLCDEVVVLRDGEVVSAGPAAEALTPATIATAFDVQAEVMRHPRTGAEVFWFRSADADVDAAHDDKVAR